MQRLRYLPYLRGAPFTVVRATGKYCNVLLYSSCNLSVRRCNVPSPDTMVCPPLQCFELMHPLPLQRFLVPDCNYNSTTCFFPLQRFLVLPAMQRDLLPLQHSSATIAARLSLPLQHIHPPSLQRNPVSRCNKFVPTIATLSRRHLPLQCNLAPPTSTATHHHLSTTMTTTTCWSPPLRVDRCRRRHPAFTYRCERPG